MKKHNVKIGSLVFLGLPLVLLGGCATNASVGQMVYIPLTNEVAKKVA